MYLNAQRSVGACLAAGHSCLGSGPSAWPAAAAVRVGLAADTDRQRGTSARLTVDLASLSCQGSVRVPLFGVRVYLPGRTVAGQGRGVPWVPSQQHPRLWAQLLAPLKHRSRPAGWFTVRQVGETLRGKATGTRGAKEMSGARPHNEKKSTGPARACTVRVGRPPAVVVREHGR